MTTYFIDTYVYYTENLNRENMGKMAVYYMSLIIKIKYTGIYKLKFVNF